MLCRSILVVEGDEEIRWTIRQLLENEGYHVLAAANGKEGLDILPEVGSPCLILLDLMMPVVNGWEFLNQKTHDIKIAPIPVVVVTGYGANGLPQGAAKSILKKPIDLETLLNVVKEYCGIVA